MLFLLSVQLIGVLAQRPGDPRQVSRIHLGSLPHQRRIRIQSSDEPLNELMLPGQRRQSFHEGAVSNPYAGVSGPRRRPPRYPTPTAHELAAESFGTAAALARSMQASTISIGSLIAASVLIGCVARDKYDAALSDATHARAALEAHEKLEQELRGESRAELVQLRHELTETQVLLASAQQEVEFAGGIAVTCGEALDESTTLNEGLKAELERLGRNVNDLAAVKAELTGSLTKARAGLEELRGAQAAADAQAALFRDVATRLRRMLDAGELNIALRSGRMVLVLPSDVLFEPGRAKVGAKGRAALEEVGRVLSGVEGRHFQVSGHTDADPIRISGFESNWQLSSARALEVVGILIHAGMAPTALSAAGYAEFDAVTANDTAVNKAKNRRIEIALQPNIDQLVDVPR